MENVDFSIGSSSAYLKIDARAGAFKVRGPDDNDITFSAATFAVDMASLGTGWLAFIKGEGPRFVAGLSNPQPASIGPVDFKKGFRVNVHGKDIVEVLRKPLGVREVTSTAFVVRKEMAGLFGRYQRECGAHPGQIPVVEVSAFKSVTMKNGSAYAPIFTIVDWVDRCPELLEAANEVPAGEATEVSALDNDIPWTP